MTIIKSVTASKIVLQLDFLTPMEAHNKAELTLQARENGTRITWAMYGPSSYISKLIGLFISMDKMIGKSFEDGLSNLKAIAEK